MAAFFSIGEKKVRPGNYYRYENRGTPPTAGSADGRCAAVIRSNWGPLGSPVAIENSNDIAKFFGSGGTGGTTVVPQEQFKGGARLVFVSRLGTGGTKGNYKIMDTAATPEAVIQMTMLYPSSREFAVTIRQTLEDTDKRELLLIEGTTILEKFTFDGSSAANQVEALLEAVDSQKSNYFTLSKLADSTYALETADQDAVTAGTDPIINVDAYSAAFEALEAYRWNVLAIDTNDSATHLIMQMYLKRLLQGGKFVTGVIGEPGSVSFATRMLHASAFNDYQVVYCGHGFVDLTGELYEGYKAAARVSGLIAGTPSNQSLTHIAISGAVSLSESLTNFQYEQATLSGMLTFSLSPLSTVWVEAGINTLVVPGSNEDEGWKKIKRTKVRFELFQRLDDTTAMLIGRINNDPDGRATIIQSGNAVCNAMVAEQKLHAGAHIELDKDNPPAGDSAWFVVVADDIDALEKAYYVFRFRFSAEAA